MNALEPAVDKDGHAQCTGNTSREPGTVRGTARRPHFSLAFISVTVQLRIYVFLVISVYFNLRNILPGTFPRDTLYTHTHTYIHIHLCILLTDCMYFVVKFSRRNKEYKFSVKRRKVTSQVPPLNDDAFDEYTISFEAVVNSTIRFCW